MKFEGVKPDIENVPGVVWSFSLPENSTFFPQALLDNPEKYFREVGVNIKPGEVKRDKSGRIREDPDAVKVFPEWTTPDGRVIQSVGKRVNITKGRVGESGDPNYECRIIQKVHAAGLPAARLLGTVTQGDGHYIFTEKISGFGWYERENLEGIPDVFARASEMMAVLEAEFERAGIHRTWKLKDMVVLPDPDRKSITAMTPTDWERTIINEEKYNQYLRSKHL